MREKYLVCEDGEDQLTEALGVGAHVAVATEIYLPEKGMWVFDRRLDWVGEVLSLPPVSLGELPYEDRINVMPLDARGGTRHKSIYPRIIVPGKATERSGPDGVFLSRLTVVALGRVPVQRQASSGS